MQKKRNN